VGALAESDDMGLGWEKNTNCAKSEKEALFSPIHPSATNEEACLAFFLRLCWKFWWSG